MNSVMYVSAVSDHLLVLSNVTLTVPTFVETVLPFAFVIFPLTVPENTEESERLSVSVKI